MTPQRPPDFLTIADADAKRAFLRGHPDVVQWLGPGTTLFKWTRLVTTLKGGVSPWWMFLQHRTLANGAHCPGIQGIQEYAARLGVQDRDYARARFAVTKEWNKMTWAVAIALVNGAWGYVAKASGQPIGEGISKVYFVGGEYQVWVPGLIANDIRRVSILPYLKPNSRFGQA